MGQGPLLNKYEANKITGEDHLGIRYVSILISDKLQHGITSITPRARYWSFYTWVLHDFIQNEDHRSLDNFKKFLKKHEWFYILANIGISEKEDESVNGLIGVNNGRKRWNKDKDVFNTYRNYVKNSRGGYGTAYTNVLKILGLTRASNTDEGVEIDRLTYKGKELANAFKETIKDTEYYTNYRFKDNIPREVLLEYGKVAGLGKMVKDSFDLPILRKLFIPKDPKNKDTKMRSESLKYYQYILSEYQVKNMNLKKWRKIMYDKYSTDDKLPDELKVVACGWEIYHGRQLFAFSLETIWSYLLNILSIKTCSYKELINIVLKELKENNILINKKTKELINEVPLQIHKREEYISKMKNSKSDVISRVYNPFKVMIDVYKRFKNRDDFKEIHEHFFKEGNKDNISLYFWQNTVNQFSNKTIREFLSYIIKRFILFQHKKTALQKLLTTNNETFHFVEDEGKLHFKAEDNPSFNVFRVNQGVSILNDLNLI